MPAHRHGSAADRTHPACVLNRERHDSPYEIPAAASSKRNPGDAPSLSMAESNKLGAKLRLIPLGIHAFNQEAGAKEGRVQPTSSVSLPYGSWRNWHLPMKGAC